MSPRRLFLLVSLGVSFLTQRARADPPPAKGADPPPAKDDAPDYDTPRFEPAGFPLVGGDSDIGFQFGGVATLTKFKDGIHPYQWNMDLLLALSVKDGPRGPEIVQQNYFWQWDIPGLYGGRLRLNPALSYQRTVNEGYFGLGNASSPTRPATVTGDPARYFEHIAKEADYRQLARIVIHKPYDLMLAGVYRYVDPSTYAGSKLDTDAHSVNSDGSPVIRGLRALSLVSLGAGLVYDTRNEEIFPRSGAYYQVGTKFVQAFPLDASVRYGETSAILAAYVPLFGPAVLATRLALDFQYGNVPFYDLYTGGPFITTEMIGGSSGIRGVPIGRYLGHIKAMGNVELRALLVAFRLAGQKFTLGGNTFFDTGRVWNDYSFHSPLDGKGVGLKYGAGIGAYLLWGQAALFRVEMAYSPDAASENPGFPFGLYVEDGVMF